jgi:lipopolysaccharide biosynthesis glycosyltransferase
LFLFPSIKYDFQKNCAPAAVSENIPIVNIAFCFDENFYPQARDSIISLLHNSAGKCHYNIYCVADQKTENLYSEELTDTARRRDVGSSLKFLRPNSDFDQSFMWKTVAVYYRLMLPQLLPHVDKIIYADADTIFCSDLAEVDKTDLGTDFICAVRDIINVSSIWKEHRKRTSLELIRGSYINSGFLIMNLKEIRAANLYARWVDLSKSGRHYFPDQDILSHTCHEKTTFLPLKYNFIPQVYIKALHENVYSAEEYEEAASHPVMIHYAGSARMLTKEKAFANYMKNIR